MKIGSIVAAALFALTAGAEIIDRIVASVDTRVITQSEIERQIRVTAFQDAIHPDLTARHRRAALETMIDQKLIQRDLENGRYPLPDPAELNPIIELFKKDHFASAEDYTRALADYKITDEDFRDLLLWQRTLLSFIEMRFESGVQVTDQEIADYFEKNVKPVEAAARLEDYRDRIESAIVGERIDQEAAAWLKRAHERYEIVYHPEALK